MRTLTILCLFVGCAEVPTVVVDDSGKEITVVNEITDLNEFLDYTKNYKGTVVTLRLVFWRRAVPLRRGGDCTFFKNVIISVLSAKSNDPLRDTIAKFDSLDDLPNISWGDTCIVTFLCEEGKMDQGNRAIRIIRP